jgi:hypothetical protein
MDTIKHRGSWKVVEVLLSCGPLSIEEMAARLHWRHGWSKLYFVVEIICTRCSHLHRVRIAEYNRRASNTGDVDIDRNLSKKCNTLKDGRRCGRRLFARRRFPGAHSIKFLSKRAGWPIRKSCENEFLNHIEKISSIAYFDDRHHAKGRTIISNLRRREIAAALKRKLVTFKNNHYDVNYRTMYALVLRRIANRLENYIQHQKGLGSPISWKILPPKQLNSTISSFSSHLSTFGWIMASFAGYYGTHFHTFDNFIDDFIVHMESLDKKFFSGLFGYGYNLGLKKGDIQLLYTLHYVCQKYNGMSPNPMKAALTSNLNPLMNIKIYGPRRVGYLMPEFKNFPFDVKQT